MWSMAGSAHISRDPELIRRLWSPTYRAWFPEGKDDREATAIRVVVDRIDYWEPPSSQVVRLVQAVKALLTTPGRRDSEEDSRRLVIKKWSKTTRDPLSSHCLRVIAVRRGGGRPGVPRRVRFTSFERGGCEVDVLCQSCIDELCRREAATYRRYPLNALPRAAGARRPDQDRRHSSGMRRTHGRARSADSCRATHSSPAIRNTRRSGTLNNSASKSRRPRFDTTIWAG